MAGITQKSFSQILITEEREARWIARQLHQDFRQVLSGIESDEVWDLLRRHSDMEKRHREFVAEIKYLTKTPALRYLFEQIWEDEKKDHMILETSMTKRFEKDPEAEWGFLLGY
jgi:hypothetical protein